MEGPHREVEQKTEHIIGVARGRKYMRQVINESANLNIDNNERVQKEFHIKSGVID